jgi:hypothetical protein
MRFGAGRRLHADGVRRTSSNVQATCQRRREICTSIEPEGSGGKDSEQDSRSLQEVEKGLLMLIASDAPGLQFAHAVLGCDPNGRWYLPYNDLDPGDL